MSNLGTRIENMPETMFNWQLADALEAEKVAPDSNTVIQFKTHDDKPAFAEYLSNQDEWQVFTCA